MPQTIRTEDQLLAELPDNNNRLIKPVHSRDIVVSAFGAVQGFDPGELDDLDNSNGNGFFDAASKWLNTVTPSVWVCINGQHHLADWMRLAWHDQLTVVQAGPGVSVSYDGYKIYTVSAAAGGATFDPCTVPNCIVCLEQDGTLFQDAAGTVPVANGSPVGYWQDESGAGHHFIRWNNDSYRPTFVQGAYGSLNAVRFAGAHELTATLASLTTGTQGTWFVVVNFSSSGNANVTCFGDIASNQLLGMQSAGPRWLTSYAAGNWYQDHAASLDGIHVICRAIDTNPGPAATARVGYFDGVQETLTVIGGLPAHPVGSTGEVFLGGLSGAEEMTGDVLALVVYDRLLSPAEIQAISNYLRNKYQGANIPSLLAIAVLPGSFLTGPSYAPTLDLTTVGDHPECTCWTAIIDLDYTDLNAGGGVVSLYSLADYEALDCIAYETTVEFKDSTPSTQPWSLDHYINGLPAGTFVGPIGGGVEGPFAQTQPVTLNQIALAMNSSVVATASIANPPLTQGHARVWLRIATLPH